MIRGNASRGQISEIDTNRSNAFFFFDFVFNKADIPLFLVYIFIYSFTYHSSLTILFRLSCGSCDGPLGILIFVLNWGFGLAFQRL